MRFGTMQCGAPQVIHIHPQLVSRLCTRVSTSFSTVLSTSFPPSRGRRSAPRSWPACRGRGWSVRHGGRGSMPFLYPVERLWIVRGFNKWGHRARRIRAPRAARAGLRPYGSSGITGKQLISLAASLGYKGILMGMWSPGGRDKLRAAAGWARLRSCRIARRSRGWVLPFTTSCWTRIRPIASGNLDIDGVLPGGSAEPVMLGGEWAFDV